MTDLTTLAALIFGTVLTAAGWLILARIAISVQGWTGLAVIIVGGGAWLGLITYLATPFIH